MTSTAPKTNIALAQAFLAAFDAGDAETLSDLLRGCAQVGCWSLGSALAMRCGREVGTIYPSGHSAGRRSLTNRD